MNKHEVVAAILGARLSLRTTRESGKAFAPTNIALCKYWGKRDAELNLPVTPSLSISLGDKGATAALRFSDSAVDSISLNGQDLPITSAFGQRVAHFLNLFRQKAQPSFHLDLDLNIPFAAGLASSACGFASLVLALNDFFAWNLKPRDLSILARLGSGSACRSLSQGFVEWRAGIRTDGMDSFGDPLAATWPELRLGLMIVSKKEKPLSSREAMERTINTSPFYAAWSSKVERDLPILKQAIHDQDFTHLGKTAESNALSMHALMLSAWPPISYSLPETVEAMQKIWALRQQGCEVYFTQDAGPNLKLIFLKDEADVILRHFPGLEVLAPLEI